MPEMESVGNTTCALADLLVYRNRWSLREQRKKNVAAFNSRNYTKILCKYVIYLFYNYSC